MQFFSQAGQDMYLLESFFRGKRRGMFLDIGAGDGVTGSNTLFFERSMDWSGLCVEPAPEIFERLQARRKAACEQVDWASLPALLQKHSLSAFDLCSLDAPGFETAILAALDRAQVRVAVFTIENPASVSVLRDRMASKGYDFVTQLGQQDIYRRLDVPRLPRTTIITAVWHKDPNRWELLEGHHRNLQNLRGPIDTIYVFDNGELPPGWLTGRTISSREPLTIYQAWNMALSQVETPFVMNLNLDDRLAPDGVSRMEHAMLEQQAALIGGEWNIRFTQEDTDAVVPAYPAQQLPFSAAWPPLHDVPTRLGSGTGERGTYGPGVMWRMDAHIGAPRYPWRMADGTKLINHAGDLGWWLIVERHLKKKTARLPLVIGNYYSHPEQQLDFRKTGNDEHALLASDIGLSLI